MGLQSRSFEAPDGRDVLQCRMRIAVVLALLGMMFLMGCANVPGADGRYATHDRGANNREHSNGLPVTPYVPR